MSPRSFKTKRVCSISSLDRFRDPPSSAPGDLEGDAEAAAGPRVRKRRDVAEVKARRGFPAASTEDMRRQRPGLVWISPPRGSSAPNPRSPAPPWAMGTSGRGREGGGKGKETNLGAARGGTLHRRGARPTRLAADEAAAAGRESRRRGGIRGRASSIRAQGPPGD